MARIIEITNDFLKTYVLDFYIGCTKKNVIAQYHTELKKGTIYVYKQVNNNNNNKMYTIYI